MKKTMLIIRRELSVRLLKPSFWVLTLLVPLVLAALYALPVVAAARSAQPVDVLVVDETGLFANGLRSTDLVHFRQMPSVTYAESQRRSSDLVLHIPLRETSMPREATLLYRGLRAPSLAVQSAVDGQLQQLLRTAILEDVYGLTPAERHSVEGSHIALHTRDAVTGREGLTRLKTMAALVLALLMALSLILFGAQVMRAVQEERQNRIAEVMATTVRPVQMLGGKLAGVALTALLQLVLWTLLTAAAVALVQAAAPDLFQAARATAAPVATKGLAATAQYADAASATATTRFVGDTLRGLAAIDLPLIALVFIVCFLLGFLLYGGLLAALAARLDSEAAALQWTLLVGSPLLLVPLLMPLVVRGSAWLLLLPPTAPAALVAMLPFGVAWPLALLSLLLLALAAAAALLLAARTYRKHLV